MGNFANQVKDLFFGDNENVSFVAAENKIKEQENRLHKFVPSSAEEALYEANKRVSDIKDKMFDLGYALRSDRPKSDLDKFIDEALKDSDREYDLLRDYDRKDLKKSKDSKEPVSIYEGFTTDPVLSSLAEKPTERVIPPEDIVAEVPVFSEAQKQSHLKSGSILSTILAPIRERYENLELSARRALDEKLIKSTKVTGDPSTLTAYYPALANTAVRSFLEGYRAADSDISNKVNSELQRRIDRAKEIFEDTLKEEYRQGQTKVSNAGQLIDGLAQFHVLEKKAEGELNRILGAYLAFASLLGAGAKELGNAYVKKRDERYLLNKEIMNLIRKEKSDYPSTVLVDPSDPQKMLDYKE